MENNKVKVTFIFDPVKKRVSNVEIIPLVPNCDLTDELVTFKITTLQISDNVLHSLELKPGNRLGIAFDTNGDIFLVNPKMHGPSCSYIITGKRTVSVRTVIAKPYLKDGAKFTCVKIERGKIQLLSVNEIM